MKTLILNESTVPQPEKFLAQWVLAISKELQKKEIIQPEVLEKELTLVFLDAGPAKKINWQFRGKDYPTDVLSFEAMEEDSLGELVLCPQVLQKQCEEHKQSYQDELGYMVLHGVLHLLGFDHEKSEDDAKKMLSLQDAMFEKLLKTPPAAPAKAPSVAAKGGPTRKLAAKAEPKLAAKAAPAKASAVKAPASKARVAKEAATKAKSGTARAKTASR